MTNMSSSVTACMIIACSLDDGDDNPTKTKKKTKNLGKRIAEENGDT